MPWLPLSVTGSAFWAGSEIIDEELARSRGQKPLELAAISAIFSLIPAVIGGVFVTGVFNAPPAVFGIAALISLLGTLACIPYYRAIQLSHPSVAQLVWNLSPAIIAIIAYFTLGERLGATAGIALFLLVVSAMFGALSPNPLTRQNRTAVLWMILASAIAAVEALLLKYLYNQTTFATGLTLTSAFTALIGIVVMASFPAVREALAAGFRSKARLFVTGEILNVGGNVLSNLAMSIGPVSLVKAVEGTQPVFILLFEHLAGKRSKRDALVLGRSIFATATGIIGLFLIGDLG